LTRKDRDALYDALTAVAAKIRLQMPDTVDGDLMAAVIARAIADLLLSNKYLHAVAVTYLSGRIDAAEVCGLDSDWIRRIVAEAGIYTFTKEKTRDALLEVRTKYLRFRRNSAEQYDQYGVDQTWLGSTLRSAGLVAP
jgi:hypothetical protein